MIMIGMERIVHAQTVLLESKLEELKEKTGEMATKNAIARAVEHYLICPHTHEDPMVRRLEEVIERKIRVKQ